MSRPRRCQGCRNPLGSPERIAGELERAADIAEELDDLKSDARIAAQQLRGYCRYCATR